MDDKITKEIDRVRKEIYTLLKEGYRINDNKILVLSQRLDVLLNKGFNNTCFNSDKPCDF